MQTGYLKCDLTTPGSSFIVMQKISQVNVDLISKINLQSNAITKGLRRARRDISSAWNISFSLLNLCKIWFLATLEQTIQINTN